MASLNDQFYGIMSVERWPRETGHFLQSLERHHMQLQQQSSKKIKSAEAILASLPTPTLSEDKSMYLWPATPEDTPPQSPRAAEAAAWSVQPQMQPFMLAAMQTCLPACTPQPWNEHVQVMMQVQPLQLSPKHDVRKHESARMARDAHECASVASSGELGSTTASTDGTSMGFNVGAYAASASSVAVSGGALTPLSLQGFDGSMSLEPTPWWTAGGADRLVGFMNQLHEAALASKGASVDAASADLRALLRVIVESAWTMAVRRHGCRVVQKALEVADRHEQFLLVDQLRGRLVEAVRSPHANHVLQRSIVLLPQDRLTFVAEELRGHGLELARHRFGCRVLERLIEHLPLDPMAGLIQEILGGVVDLCRHEFGNYVVQHVFEHGSVHHRACAAAALMPHAYKLAKHRVASHVIERALRYCSDTDRERLIDAISGESKDLSSLGRSLYGSFVVRQLAARSGKQDKAICA